MPLKDAMEQFQDEFVSIQKVAWKKNRGFATKISRYRDRENFDQTGCSDISCWNLKDALFCISCIGVFFGKRCEGRFGLGHGLPSPPSP